MLDTGVDRRGPPKPAGPVTRALTAVAELVLPTLGLLASFGVIWLLRAEPATDFRFLKSFDASLDPAADGWLTWGVLLVPLSFFVLNLTSRRYGPSVAFNSVLLAWAIVGGGIYWAMSEGLIASFEREVAPVALAAAFAVAMFAGQIIGIYMFDWLRGIPWWEAPLIAALLSGLVFTVVFHAAMRGDWSEQAWPRLAVLAGLQLIWAVLQLLPTQMCRRVIRPASGYGGA